MGVREHSRAAAIIVAAFFLFNLAGSAVVIGMPPGFIPLGILCLLLANIRGTWIASRWQKVDDAFPDRMRRRGGIVWWTFCRRAYGRRATFSFS
jgi:membrane protein implicated in regulation of membrane protease activity